MEMKGARPVTECWMGIRKRSMIKDMAGHEIGKEIESGGGKKGRKIKG